jgi:hypothetical protein
VFSEVFKLLEGGTLPSAQASSQRARQQHVEEQENILGTTNTRRLYTCLGAFHGGTMLQTGRSRVRFPLSSFDVSVY